VSGEDQILPVQHTGIGAYVEASAELHQILIKCGDPIRIIGYEAVCRDRRTIVDLEVVAERFTAEVVRGFAIPQVRESAVDLTSLAG
jgi:hypothetical protein